MSYKKRCKDCSYLVEVNNNWVCDIDGKECCYIDICNAVEIREENKDD